MSLCAVYEPRYRRYVDLQKLPFDVVRVRDFLRIPYLYTIPDDFDKDTTDYAHDPIYQEDLRVDGELAKISAQVAGFIFSRTGICIKDLQHIYKFNGVDGGIVKIVPSPTFAINSFVVDGVEAPIVFERDDDYFVDLGVNKFDTAQLDFSCGFNVTAETKYRNGNDFTATEDNGVPYTFWKPAYALPDMLIHLWDMLTDHFYQHRGITVVGTIVAKIPTSLDVLLQSVRSLAPHDLYPTPDALTYAP